MNNIHEYPLDNSHRAFWEEPQNHELLREIDPDGNVYYSIYSFYPRLMMLLCDDMEYANALAAKMLDADVKVFDNIISLDKWTDQQRTNQNK